MSVTVQNFAIFAFTVAMTKVGLCCALACFHSDSVSSSSLRIECHIEGSTTPGNTEIVIESINEIVTKKDFYIPGTNVSSGNSC